MPGKIKKNVKFLGQIDEVACAEAESLEPVFRDAIRQSPISNGNRILVRISDHGPGMDALILPRVALELGYSTGHSLGMGYAVILALSDEVCLSTGPAGTTVVIGMDMEQKPDWTSIEMLPDTW